MVGGAGGSGAGTDVDPFWGTPLAISGAFALTSPMTLGGEGGSRCGASRGVGDA